MKMKINISLVFAIIVLFFVGNIVNSKSAKAASYITDVTITSGNEAENKLINEGYTIVGQPLNITMQNGKKAYLLEDKAIIKLGYKSGNDDSNAYRDFIITVGEESKDKISVKDISYKLISNIDLNQGVDGEKIYLYGTKSKSAGNAIIDFCFTYYQKGISKDYAGYALLNDGSSPIRDTERNVGNFDAGRENVELYINMIRDNSCSPYISKAVVVSASDKRNCIKKIAKLGYDYYLDLKLKNSSEKYSMIGYQRTANKDDAITSIIASTKNENELSIDNMIYAKCDGEALVTKKSTYYLYIVKDKEKGYPIIDLLSNTKYETDITMGYWIKSKMGNSASAASAYIQNESAYRKMLDSNEKQHQFSIMIDSEKECNISYLSSALALDSNKISNTSEPYQIPTDVTAEVTPEPTIEPAVEPTIEPTIEPEDTEEPSEEPTSDKIDENVENGVEEDELDNNAGIADVDSLSEDTINDNEENSDSQEEVYIEALDENEDSDGQGEDTQITGSALGSGNIVVIIVILIILLATAGTALVLKIRNKKDKM